MSRSQHVLTQLTQFEDTLLGTDGFFARECHLEARIDAVRAEFEASPRAHVLFGNAPAVAMLIRQLIDDEDECDDEAAATTPEQSACG
eukprot:5613437-Pleurochrysis_carterae.AAC.2